VWRDARPQHHHVPLWPLQPPFQGHGRLGLLGRGRPGFVVDDAGGRDDVAAVVGPGIGSLGGVMRWYGRDAR